MNKVIMNTISDDIEKFNPKGFDTASNSTVFSKSAAGTVEFLDILKIGINLVMLGANAVGYGKNNSDAGASGLMIGSDNSNTEGTGNTVVGNSNTIGSVGSTGENTVIGISNTVTKSQAVVVGRDNVSNSDRGITFGYSNTVQGADNVIMIGTDNGNLPVSPVQDSGSLATAVGFNNTPKGNYSLTAGYSNNAYDTGASQVVVGASNEAGDKSVAIGIDNGAGTDNVVIGQSNNSNPSSIKDKVILIGSGNNALADSTTIGHHNNSSASSSKIIGRDNSQTGREVIVVGDRSDSIIGGTISIGNDIKNNLAYSAVIGHAVGSDTLNMKLQRHQLLAFNKVSSNSSLPLQWQTIDTGGTVSLQDYIEIDNTVAGNMSIVGWVQAWRNGTSGSGSHGHYRVNALLAWNAGSNVSVIDSATSRVDGSDNIGISFTTTFNRLSLNVDTNNNNEFVISAAIDAVLTRYE